MDAQLLRRLRAWLDQQGLLHTNARLVVAVSGGPDSLCLLHLLWRLRQNAGPQIHVAHLDHMLRGAESAAEAAFVAAMATRLHIPATIEQRDVSTAAHSTGLSKQAAARHVRYAFLADVALAVAADAVAVAHHADDQAETVVLHLLRGAGPAGMRGMRAVVPWAEWATSASVVGPPLIRPLRATRRTMINAYIAAHSLDPRHDPSNDTDDYARNRVRHHLLPVLAEYNPQIVTALGRTAQIYADDYAYIQSQLDAAWPTLAEQHCDHIVFHRATWAATPATLQRYALRRATLLLAGRDELSQQQTEAGRSATARSPEHRHQLGCGLALTVGYNGFVVARAAAAVPMPGAATAPQLGADMVALAVPGVAALSNAWHVEARWSSPATPDATSRWWVALDADCLDAALMVRCRRAGDRFRPRGGQGSRLLQDFFVDQKIQRHLRDRWPIVATPSAVVWVAGLRADARFVASEASQRVVWVGVVNDKG